MVRQEHKANRSLLTSIFCLLIILSSCNNSKKKSSEPVFSKQEKEICEKCNKQIIEKLVEESDSINFEDLRKFICSLDTSCSFYADLYPYEGTEGTYEELAREVLVINLYYHFGSCMKILSNLNEVDKYFPMKLIDNVDTINDLPFPQILDSLRAYEGQEALKNELIEVVDRKVY